MKDRRHDEKSRTNERERVKDRDREGRREEVRDLRDRGIDHVGHITVFSTPPRPVYALNCSEETRDR